MKALWQTQRHVDFKEIGPNLYIVEFQDKNDFKKVQDGRLWTFDKYRVCITSFNRNLVPQDFSFNRELSWVQLHQLLLGMMNQKYEESMGEILGEF